jgi:hypothetical protein
MPNIDSSGEKGRSMDYSQFLDIKKRHKIVSSSLSKPDFPKFQVGDGRNANSVHAIVRTSASAVVRGLVAEGNKNIR